MIVLCAMLHACYVDAREIEEDTHNELGGDHIDLKRCDEKLSLHDDVTSLKRSGSNRWKRRLCGSAACLGSCHTPCRPGNYFEYVAINNDNIRR